MCREPCSDETLARAGRYRVGAVDAPDRGRAGPAPGGQHRCAALVEPAGLARAVAASFLGLELYEGVDPDGATSAMAALESLGNLLEMVDADSAPSAPGGRAQPGSEDDGPPRLTSSAAFRAR